MRPKNESGINESADLYMSSSPEKLRDNGPNTPPNDANTIILNELLMRLASEEYGNEPQNSSAEDDSDEIIQLLSFYLSNKGSIKQDID